MTTENDQVPTTPLTVDQCHQMIRTVLEQRLKWLEGEDTSIIKISQIDTYDAQSDSDSEWVKVTDFPTSSVKTREDNFLDCHNSLLKNIANLIGESFCNESYIEIILDALQTKLLYLSAETASLNQLCLELETKRSHGFIEETFTVGDVVEQRLHIDATHAQQQSVAIEMEIVHLSEVIAYVKSIKV